MRIVKLPEVTVAVRRFSGSWDEEQLERRKVELLRAWRSRLAPDRQANQLVLRPAVDTFLRRNEVAVPVARAAKTS